ncbi:cellulase family glycosylhydrolase [Limnochorda pilosa]|uniref:Glycoside hydrolase family 5 n=1 Tax=Limnochorda pilosa TaxID=1555112 RepID=A0A0K2SLF6_LIMPI|nr:cellulase family glycosylhydrolase [Limnochorda pilosa]BAS27961.1 glycoside hydrolase family 5 [Limnochorda pilosa]
MKFLRAEGKKVVDTDGREVRLRGVAVGGWLNMENFITGYPGCESRLRSALLEELGEERYRTWMTSFVEAFFSEEDIRFLRGLGATVVRVPFNYRLFEDDDRPGVYKDEGFVHLDRIVRTAETHGMYVILDLHAAPGWQNEGWHADNPTGVSLFWQHRDFQARARDLWAHIADHYRDTAAVAGYDLLNEPNAPSVSVLNRLYKELAGAIRRVDRRHILFLEGNDWSRRFDGLDEALDENVVWSSHNYTVVTHKARRYPGPVEGVYGDRAWLRRDLEETNRWMLERDLPNWVGEFGALYDGDVLEPTPSDQARLAALKDQIELFDEFGFHWTLWTYKDVGPQGLVVPGADSEYLRRLRPMLRLKQELGLDKWTTRDLGWPGAAIRHLVDQIGSRLWDFSLDLAGLKEYLVERVVYGDLANAVVPLYAMLFADMSPEEIAVMQREAFELKNGRRREGLIEVLSASWKS